MDPITQAILTALAGAGASTLGGVFSRQQPSMTPMQKKQSSIIDEILQGVKGQGQFADLFNADEAAFQRSIVDPSMSRFRNQIAPQIQQSYIQSGQQRGSGLEDTLARAGVDLNALIDQQYGQFQQNAQNRQLNALNTVLGAGPGVGSGQGAGSAAGQAFSGWLTSPGAEKGFASVFDLLNGRSSSEFEQENKRRGYA